MEELLYYFFSLLPTIVCLELIFSYLVRADRTKAENHMLMMLICICAYTFVEVLCKSVEVSMWTAVGMAVCCFAMPLLPMLSIYYISDLAEMPIPKKRQRIELWAAMAYGILTTLMLMLSDRTQVVSLLRENMGNIFSPNSYGTGVEAVYQVLIGPCLWIMSCLGAFTYLIVAFRLFRKRESRTGQFFRFLFKGEGITPFYLSIILCVLFCLLSYARLLTPSYLMVEQPVISILYGLALSIVLHFEGHLGRYTYMESITTKTSYTNRLFREAQAQVSSIVQTDLPSATEETMDKLQQRMVRLIEDDFWFLRKDVSLELVAQELMTNRVYISRILNQRMQTTFRDYINRLRIEYSQGWVSQHPNDSAAEVAEACGFNDVQRFQLKFKQYQDMTFDEWKRHRQAVTEV